MAVYSVRKAIKKLDKQGAIRLKHDVFPEKGRSAGSLLEVVQALYATYIPWEITFADTEEMAVHAATIHTGRRGQVLYFGGAYHAHFSYIHDPQTDEIRKTEPNMPFVVTTDMFCSGHALLFDGTLLVAGGQLPAPDGESDEHKHGGMAGGGERHSYIYMPTSGRWREITPLNLDPDGSPDSGGRWYPVLLTLANGLVLAVGGHPNVKEVYPNRQNQRHSNNIPELYNPATNKWTLLTGDTTAENPVAAYDYQRIHLLPDGKVLFSSPVKGANRVYNVSKRSFKTTPVVDLPAEAIYRHATVMAVYTSVMLPLLHEENYVARVLLAGGQKSYVCDFGDDAGPAWRETPRRDWPDGVNPPVRNYSTATLLPTGDVFLSGGTKSTAADGKVSQDACVREGEIFSPNLDRKAAADGSPAFDLARSSWKTVQRAHVRRRYHSTALLLADGSVWTAGSNGTLDYDEKHGVEPKSERRIELYRPPYLEAADRPEIVSAPEHIEPGDNFEVSYTSKFQIEQVVFLRNGSVTHAFNSDQRLITAAFQKLGRTRLRVTAPPNHSIAPPGYYMLWLLDSHGSPCRQAHFVRILDS